MARAATNYTLRKDRRTGVYTVRFTHNGRRVHRSTGESNLGRAKAVAAKIYTAAKTGRRVSQGQGQRLDVLFAHWLAAIEPEVTPATFKGRKYYCAKLLIPFFETIENVTTASAEDYTRARLRKVQRTTVKKEIDCLRAAMRWGFDRGYVENRVVVNQPAKKSKGTVSQSRPRVDLQPWQAERIIDALPERSWRGRPIKALFVIYWETGLRRECVEKLRTPEHFRPGDRFLTITSDIDKNQYARQLPLTDRAIQALEFATAGDGLIFGTYCYFKTLRKAASGVSEEIGLSPEQVQSLDARDFRHAATTDGASVSKELAGVAYAAGHRKLSTTDRYIHATTQSAQRVLAARFPEARRDTEGTPLLSERFSEARVDTEGAAGEAGKHLKRSAYMCSDPSASPVGTGGIEPPTPTVSRRDSFQISRGKQTIDAFAEPPKNAEKRTISQLKGHRVPSEIASEMLRRIAKSEPVLLAHVVTLCEAVVRANTAAPSADVPLAGGES